MSGWRTHPPLGELKRWEKQFGRLVLIAWEQKHGFRLATVNGRELGGDSAEFYPSLEAAEAAFRVFVIGWLDRTP